MKSVIIVAGPVGAGKTTISRELVEISSAPVAYVEGDEFWKFIAKFEPDQTRNKQIGTTMTCMTVTAATYAMHGYETVLDFSIPPWFLPSVQKIAAKRNVPVDYVLLMSPQEVCAARAASRNEGVIEDYSVYSEFYATFRGMPEHLVDTEHLDPHEIAQQIRAGVDEMKFRLKS